jgi:hypothetical protein
VSFTIFINLLFFSAGVGRFLYGVLPGVIDEYGAGDDKKTS